MKITKNLLTLILLIILHSYVSAQKITFSDNTNAWSVIDSTVGCCIPIRTAYTITTFDTSVTYNGHTYKHLNDYQGSCLIREDSGRVYVISTTDSIERTLYDFNLGINDTLRTIYPQDTFVAWVSAMDSTVISGLTYKVWHYFGIDYNAYFPDSQRVFEYNVIEGIGSTNGPYYPASPYSLTAFSEQLLCFTNASHTSSVLSTGVLAYGNKYSSYFENNTSCILFAANHPVDNTLVSHLQSGQSVITAIPNPGDANTKLIFEPKAESGSLKITNILGQVVANIPINNCTEIPIGQYAAMPGVYIYRYTDNLSTSTITGKFIVK